MTYSTLAQVQGYIASTAMNPSSMPTDAQVNGLIADGSAMVDAKLASRGYVVPATAPAALVADLGVLVAKYAAGHVVAQSTPTYVEGLGAVVNPYARELLDQWEAGLVELESAMVPVGVAINERQQSPIGYLDSMGAWGNNLGATDVFDEPIRSQPAFRRNHDL